MIGPPCRDTNPELFFPIGTTGLAIDQIDAAKPSCAPSARSAPSASSSCSWTNQEAGVWGGTTEDERRKLRKGWTATSSEIRGS